ncbi:MAG: alpha/beta fold hydrolase, partial [Luteibaculum sp.]
MEIEIEKEISCYTYQHHEQFQLENGGELAKLKLCYHTFGELNAQRNNVVWVFHPLSANSNVSQWWAGIFGEGKLLDPREHYIICVNALGSPYGSSAPRDLSFPEFTLRDVARTQILLAKHLGISFIHLLIGASFGGSLALEFNLLFPGEIENNVLISCAAKETEWAKAIHEAQRLAIEPYLETDSAKGLEVARAFALVGYRSPEGYQKNAEAQGAIEARDARSYIRHNAKRFTQRFSTLSYYYLGKCLDSHDVGNKRGGLSKALKDFKGRSLLIAVDSDQLVPPKETKALSQHLPNSSFIQFYSAYGHDAFLVEAPSINKQVKNFLRSEWEPERPVLHVFSLGKGTVGGTLINQIIRQQEQNAELPVKVIGVADTRSFILDSNGLGKDWKTLLNQSEKPSNLNEILSTIENCGLKHVAIVDNTADDSLAASYPKIFERGFHLVASNKKANAADFSYYHNLRQLSKTNGVQFLYETNVGAGLPVIEPLQRLISSGEKLTEIKGVFSGSLSYLFNRFSVEEVSFSDLIEEAGKQGYTEPDAREDLNGLDVGRKLLILARECGAQLNLEDVDIENLIPTNLQSIVSWNEFWEHRAELDQYFNEKKATLLEDE